MSTKKLILLICMSLILALGVGATLAWLTDSTQKITNTFTVGDINISLTETGTTGITGTNDQSKSYKMIPGKTETKDPTVTVEAGSEACWVFVKVEKTANFDTFMEYSINPAWTELDGYEGVYYIDQSELTATDAKEVKYPVLVNNEVKVKSNVTKEMMEALTDETNPNISFKAYAVQKYGFENASDAWEEVTK